MTMKYCLFCLSFSVLLSNSSYLIQLHGCEWLWPYLNYAGKVCLVQSVSNKESKGQPVS